MATIRSIRAFTVPYREPNDHDSTRYVSLVRVTDSEGLEGWGEAVALFAEAARATTALLEGYAELLADHSADVDEVAATLAEHAWWYGGSGIACFAASALDLALWDLRGKRDQRSLSDLLGCAHSNLPTIISCHATEFSLDLMAGQLAQTVRASDASGIKVGFGKRGNAHLGYEHDRDVQFVKLLRRELGPEPWIMIDIGARIHWTVDEAIARVRAFEEHGVHWTEEPLGANDPSGYRRLKASTSSLIAYGEREWSPSGYEAIIGTGTVDVVGIDPGRAMGITGFRQTLRLAEAAGIQANAHAFAGPITFAASVALSLSSTACQQLEVMPQRNTLYDLADAAPVPTKGRIQAASEHGLGVVIDASAVEKASLQ